MRHRLHALGALVVVLTCVFMYPRSAAAAPLIDLTGRVSLADGEPSTGTSVTLQVDLDGNGQFAKFETLSAKVKADGSYALRYELDLSKIDLEFLSFVRKLLSDFNARGFDALLDRGPLPIMVTMERPGYSTISKRFSTMLSSATLDAVLGPLAEISCTDDVCMTPGGSVRMQDFPVKTGIARAYAQAYDPGLNAERFPGTFSDDEGNLLVSSGFAEINLFDDKGKPIHEVPEPVAVRFAMDRASWSTLPDLEVGTGRIELPMYSFDRDRGEWTREEDGELQQADGTPIAERALEAIRAGDYGEDIFVAFRTKHFSTFNCDAPVAERACVKGRLVDEEGKPWAGVSVWVDGSSYSGSAGTLITAASGYFASDVRRSEPAGQDLDRNGAKGELFRARVRASAQGTFAGDPFDTPSTKGSVFGSNGQCKAPQCECLDLGDVEARFELPRLCEVNVRVSFGGDEVAGGESMLASGDVVAAANVSASLVGDQMPWTEAHKLCGDKACGFATTHADGTATLTVPVLGSAPRLQLLASFSRVHEGDVHYYSGALVLDGCPREVTALEGETELRVSHAQLGRLSTFLAALTADPDANQDLVFCDCRLAGGAARSFGPATLGLGLLGLTLWLRRRKP